MSPSSLSPVRLALAAAVLCVLTLSSMCSAQTCCTRPGQLEAIYDGIHVMDFLVAHTDSTFLSGSVTPRPVLTVMGDLLAIIRQKEELEQQGAEMTDTVRALIDAVINDSCSYINEALEVTMLQCDNSTTVQRFYDRLTLANSVIDLFQFMRHSQDQLDLEDNSKSDLYAYWKVHVEDTCSGSECSDFLEIRDRIFNFRVQERQCTCSD